MTNSPGMPGHENSSACRASSCRGNQSHSKSGLFDTAPQGRSSPHQSVPSLAVCKGQRPISTGIHVNRAPLVAPHEPAARPAAQRARVPRYCRYTRVSIVDTISVRNLYIAGSTTRNRSARVGAGHKSPIAPYHKTHGHQLTGI